MNWCKLFPLLLLACWAPAAAGHGPRSGAWNPDLSWRPNVVVPTRGGVWPLPLNQTTGRNLLSLDPNEFSFQYDGSCDVVQRAIQRYRDHILFAGCKAPGGGQGRRGPWRRVALATLDVLNVTVTGKCEELPHPDMDESYKLLVRAHSDSFLTAETVWGALRALETFSQLVYTVESGEFVVNETAIYDKPRFSHRGLLIDTSRHFLPVHAIVETLDAMAYNKLNVLHWHIVDDPSFPYVSKTFPSLSEKGAYYPETHVYQPEDVQRVISEASARGIRVMAEFDTPGHTRSWGAAFPDVLTTCYKGSEPDGELGPIDPTKNGSYTFLARLFKEVADVFPDQYVHLGGDEVGFDCWKSNPNITSFMRKMGIAGNYEKLEDYYIQKLLQIVRRTGKSYMVWQEVFDNKVEVAPDTVVHVWKQPYLTELNAVTAAGFQTLLSSCWYLNHINYGADWKVYYECDPQNFTGTPQQKALVLGGEACMWGEYVDGTNLISRTWPRACAPAEKLWSPASVNKPEKASARFEEQRCRMLRRGLNVEPANGPGVCECDYVI
ncbi:beta-hexosaminidase subunit alpha-like isoform X3 [Amblyomma americanum]